MGLELPPKLTQNQHNYKIVFKTKVFPTFYTFERTFDGMGKWTVIVMAEIKAIRNMEPSWEKVCGRNFALTSRTIVHSRLSHHARAYLP